MASAESKYGVFTRNVEFTSQDVPVRGLCVRRVYPFRIVRERHILRVYLGNMLFHNRPLQKLNSLIEYYSVFFVECFKFVFLDGFAYLRHKLVIEIEVMENAKAHTEHLAGADKVAQIAA